MPAFHVDQSGPGSEAYQIVLTFSVLVDFDSRNPGRHGIKFLQVRPWKLIYVMSVHWMMLWFVLEHSTNAGNVHNRTVFGQTLANFVRNYSFDGIEMVWHHPNQEPGCADITTQTNTTTINLLTILRRLRINLGPKIRISAALPSEGLMGPGGLPLNNYSAFARVLNHVTIMVC